MTFNERRINRRIPAKFNINYVHEGDYLISHSRDLSADGMFVCTKEPPGIGEMTELTFTFDEGGPITVSAKVVWVNESDQESESGMGVQFVDMDDDVRSRVLAYVNRIALLMEEGTDASH